MNEDKINEKIKSISSAVLCQCPIYLFYQFLSDSVQPTFTTFQVGKKVLRNGSVDQTSCEMGQWTVIGVYRQLKNPNSVLTRIFSSHLLSAEL